MSKTRKPTPSLIDDLLSGKKGQAPEPAPSSAAAPEPLATSRTAGKDSAESIKATFYLSQDVADDLEEARLILIRLLRPESKHDVSKSVIVEQSIRIAIEDLKANGAGSLLAKALD